MKKNAPACVTNHQSGHSHSQEPHELECPCNVADVSLVIATFKNPMNQNAPAYVAQAILAMKLCQLRIRFLKSNCT